MRIRSICQCSLLVNLLTFSVNVSLLGKHSPPLQNPAQAAKSSLDRDFSLGLDGVENQAFSNAISTLTPISILGQGSVSISPSILSASQLSVISSNLRKDNLSQLSQSEPLESVLGQTSDDQPMSSLIDTHLSGALDLGADRNPFVPAPSSTIILALAGLWILLNRRSLLKT